MNQDITKGIQELSYNPAELLAFNGEDYENVVTQGTLENGQYIVAEKKVIDTQNKNYDIVVMNSVRDRSYPGALLLANESLVNNSPTNIYAEKGPLTLRIDLPMQTDGTVYVPNPTYSNVSEAINSLLNKWFEQYASTCSIAANYSYTESRVYNEDHLQSVVGFDLGGIMNIDFKAVSESKEQIFVLSFKQIFYSVSVDDVSEPGDFFNEVETWDSLKGKNKSMGNDAPPAYVKNTAYGRTIYVVLRTANMSSDIEANLSVLYKDSKFNVDVLSKSIFDNSEYSAYVIGGSAKDQISVITKDFGEIEKIITSNASLTKDNIGAPISYTALFIKDGATAVINSFASYVETTYTSYNNGSVRLKHKGGYVAKFYVTWDEIEYNSKGERTLTSRGWSKNGDGLTSGFETTIPIPANATNLHVKATENTGLAWEGWRTVVDQDTPVIPEVYVEISGTTLKPKHKVEYNS